MRTIVDLMADAGCLESKSCPLANGKTGHRMTFATEADAVAHRAKVGCGGWVLGPYLFAGTEWTPSECMVWATGAEGTLR